MSDHIKFEVYTSQRSGKRIEILSKLTTSGKWLLFCLTHLLFQGKNSETKQKTMPTNKWLQCELLIYLILFMDKRPKIFG